MLKKLGKVFYVLTCAVLILQLTGCGTIMYPDRRGQKGGRIDVGVAVLDGVGLFFFLIPGIIAYAVDFSTGAIYLPGGLARGPLDIKQVKFDPKNSSMADIEEIVKKETGCDVSLYGSKMQIVKMESSEEMMTRFTEVSPGINNNRVVLSMK
ncbi:MAG: hypothetical protein KKD05_07295 [Candidatus Omnitrophica bacterium]|nr:hypothetical protein [Candidatus Omnitrophota bacterium]